MYINIDLEALDAKIMEVLESNGFDKDDIGTFFYKEVIKNIVIELVDCTEEIDLNRLRTQILSQYSAFYYGIIGKMNRLDIKIFRELSIFCQLEVFHKCIVDAFAKSNIVSKNNIAVSGSVNEFGRRKQKATTLYKTLAFSMASYMLSCIQDNIEEFRNKDIKTLSLKKSNSEYNN